MIKKLLLSLTLLFVLSNGWAQIIVKGKVTDSSSQPLPGVNVILKGTTKGSITDNNGLYSVQIVDSKAILQFSFLGFVTQEIVVGNKTVIDVKLMDDIEALSEVVVTGYGTLKRANMISASSSISAKEITKSPSATIDQAMQGRVAGVSITQNSGQPGGGMNVNIRGLSSVNGASQPLYVIDGVEIDGNSSQSSGTNPMAGVNPSDIETLDVLQGPSATALFGSRGTNGVILITTKRGKSGKTSINYEYTFNYQYEPKNLPTISLQEFAIASNMVNDELGYKKADKFANPAVLGQGTNWQDEIFSGAPTHKHQLSIQGGGDKNTYYIAGEKFDQTGVVEGSYFDRVSFRANFDNKLSDWVKLSTDFNANQTKEDLTVSTDDIIVKAIQMSPDQPVKRADGSWGGPAQDDAGLVQFFTPNPLAIASLIDNERTRTNYNGTMRVVFNIPGVKGLELSSRLVASSNQSEDYYFKPTYELGIMSNYLAASSRTIRLNSNYKLDQMVEYKTILGEAHDFNFMFTHEAMGGKTNYLTASSDGHITNTVTEIQLGAANSVKATSGLSTGVTQESYLGRLNYSFKNRYIVNMAYRRDGTANFAENKRWGGFPSGSFAWRLTEEPFLKDAFGVVKIDDFKLRFESGLTGKQQWGQEYLSKISTLQSEWGTAYYPGNIENDNFQWEETMTYNVGFDLSFFKRRLQFTGDWYVRYTDNMIGALTTPWYLGLSPDWSTVQTKSPTVNNGSVENKGYGLSVKGVIVDNKGFKWEANFNISHNENKLKSLAGKDQTFIQRQLDGYASNFIARSEIDQPLWQFYGYVSDGVYASMSEIQADYARMADPLLPSLAQPGGYNTALPANSAVDKTQSWVGDFKYRDLNNDGKIDSQDQTMVGNPWPTFTGGFANDFTYKNLSLSVLLTYSYGADIYNLTGFKLSKPGDGHMGKGMLEEGANWAKFGNDPNTGELIITNPDTRIPRIAASSSHKNYDRLTQMWVEDGSYVRLKTIQLNYVLPSSLMSKQKVVSSIRLGVGVQNIYTWTKYSGYDPEIGSYTSRGKDPQTMPSGIDYGRYPSTPMVTTNILVGF